jgi:hypothetical protein
MGIVSIWLSVVSTSIIMNSIVISHSSFTLVLPMSFLSLATTSVLSRRLTSAPLSSITASRIVRVNAALSFFSRLYLLIIVKSLIASSTTSTTSATSGVCLILGWSFSLRSGLSDWFMSLLKIFLSDRLLVSVMVCIQRLF